MRVLVYKRTHEGDPDRETGTFGCNGCMGRVRNWDFDAVIGVGGTGAKPVKNGIAGKITWVGITAHKGEVFRRGGPEVRFSKFRYLGQKGPHFLKLAPNLAARIYSKKIRTVMDKLSEVERKEVRKVLALAKNANPSPGLKPPTGSTGAVVHGKSNRRTAASC